MPYVLPPPSVPKFLLTSLYDTSFRIHRSIISHLSSTTRIASS